MIAQTYCGEEMAPVSTDAGDTRWPVCGPDDGPCPSCLREHVAKLEAALRNAEAEASIFQESQQRALRERNEAIDKLEAKVAAQAGGVVVAELDADSIHPLIQWTASHRVLTGKTAEAINAWMREHSSVIPASRVLGEGEVAVDRGEWEVFRALESMMRLPTAYLNLREQKCLDGLDALRAAKGGAT